LFLLLLILYEKLSTSVTPQRTPPLRHLVIAVSIRRRPSYNQSMNRTSVAIAGGGIIGLATALELTNAGCRVTVFDRNSAMSEASRAAAGMLAASDPENPPALRDLIRLSLSLYPEFLARVQALSATAIPVRTTRTLQGAHHAPPGARPLTQAEIQALAPGAVTDPWQFFLLEEQSFDPRDLAESLPKAARAAGVDLREHTSVHSAHPHAHGIHLETSAGPFSAGVFLNATGAWAPALHAALPVSPRKGHMLTAELPGPVQMECILRTPAVYIIPRGRRRYSIGSTLEDVGFDREVYPDHIQVLFSKAVEIWPPLREAAIAESWIGFRPGSEDDLPIIDRTAPGCWVATGHFRNGILLGPGTARVLSQWITGRPPEIDLAPFRCARFAASAVSS
jgi:glycine oxidase